MCVCMCSVYCICVTGFYTAILSVSSESVDGVIEKHSLQRISLLRELAIKTGIQVRPNMLLFIIHLPMKLNEFCVS